VTSERLTTERLTTSAVDLDRASALLRAGELVAVPTETVYGLAVRADDAAAVGRLFVAKGRPTDNPLIVHVASVADVLLVASELTPTAQRLLERFAPGPITVVLPARDDLPREVTAGLDTVAVRIPDHPVTLALLARTGVPLAAPSANRSGRPSPTRAEHVLADLDGRIAAVVDAGPCRVGLESTVVDARGSTWRVLREGEVGREAIAAALDGAPERTPTDELRSPGTRHHHYAPALPVHLARAGAGHALAMRLASAGAARVGLVALATATTSADTTSADTTGAADADTGTDADPSHTAGVVRLAAPPDVATLAAELFGLLRAAEEAGLDALVVEAVAGEGIGSAVMDRLRRAVAASGGTAQA
jgi:L-threonylcarbamoyladenylate synthase